MRLPPNGQKSGKMISKYNNGIIWKGAVTSWWDDDSKYKKQIVTYLDGKKHGEVQVFYKNNNKLRYKGNYNNGLMDGKWTYYYENGKKKLRDHLKMAMEAIKIRLPRFQQMEEMEFGQAGI